MRKVKGDYTVSVEGKIIRLIPSLRHLNYRLTGTYVEIRELYSLSSGEEIPCKKLNKEEKEIEKRRKWIIKKKEVTFSYGK